MNHLVRTVLFDLDGTLLDTAPDLAEALNVVLLNNGKPALAFEQIRPMVSHGARALIELGFGIETDHPEFEPLRQQLLDYYKDHLADQTRLFPGMGEVLKAIEENDQHWGVVTNKPAWLTEPLLDILELTARAASIVSGDTLNERKPHPAPLLHACQTIGTPPHQCLYIGDAARDIQAGHNAGIRTLVATFGYIKPEDKPDTWGADAMIHHPLEILDWL